MSNGRDNQKQPKQQQPGPFNKPPQGGRNLQSWIMFILLGMMVFLIVRSMNSDQPSEVAWSEFRRRVENGEVAEVVVHDTNIVGQMKASAMVGKGEQENRQFKVIIEPGTGKEAWFQELLSKHNVEVEYGKPNVLYQVLIHLLPWVIFIALIYFLVFRQFRGAGGAGMLGSFGRSRHRVSTKEQTKITFDQVAGIDEAKEEVQEIIEFLRNPKKFQRLGGRIPRGVLLIGHPGCGKTLLAKAIAGEADVPFFSISGSDFVEMFVGVGASRVRDLFKQAKENSPCIIFLDEIDAVGRKRGTGLAGGGHDEREQTLNAILVEMDGFNSDDQVIVIAATNRADVLDHALTRPGRFDRQIYVPLPDIKGRLEILKVHARKVKLAGQVNLERLARGTPMFSGADLEAIINEAALNATMQNKEAVEMADLEEARDKVRWGRARRSRVIDEKEKMTTAFHEAGHAIVQSMLEDADPVHKVSIIPRSTMGGATFSLPEQDRTMYTRRYCEAEIRVGLGGRVAEELFCGDISSGASSDIKMASNLARAMVMEWGMSDKLGFVFYGPDENKPMIEFAGTREYSDSTAESIDAEVKQIIDRAYADVRGLLEQHRNEVEAVTKALLKYETLEGEEVKKILAGETLDKPTVAELLSAEQQRGVEQAAQEHSQDNTGPETPGLGGAMPNPA